MASVITSCSNQKRKSHDTATCRRCRHRKHGDWSNIGADLLEYIQTKQTLADILRCQAVCTSWRSITKTHLSSSLNSTPQTSPLLILWRRIRGEESGSFLDALRINGGNLSLRNKKSEQLLPPGMGDFVGYSHGYFLFLDKEHEETLYLFHPTLFFGSLVRLPPIRFSERVRSDGCRTRKALMWADPISSNNGGYGIVLLQEGSRQLLFAKCGAARFTQLEGQSNMGQNDSFVDIICVKNCIYGVTDRLQGSNHYIKAWDCSSSTIGDHGVPKLVWYFKPKFRSGPDPTSRVSADLRLVESQGEILLVAVERERQSNDKCIYYGYSEVELEPLCRVYKLDFEKREWVRMSSLGDRVLFIMEFQSMSLSSHDFPQYESNSIYFWNYYFPTYRSTEYYLAILNVEDGSVKVIDSVDRCIRSL